jgi:hypothetical protein
MNNPLDRLMWVVLDYGHQIMQLERKEHIAYCYELLTSGDRIKIKMAEEAMQRTTGVYGNVIE